MYNGINPGSEHNKRDFTVVLMNNVSDLASPFICMNIIQKSRSNSRRAKVIGCSKKQCSGSVTFWYGSGFSDPYLWLTDPDEDPDPYQNLL